MIIKKETKIDKSKEPITAEGKTYKYEYYNLVLDGLIVKIENDSLFFDDEQVELCDLEFNGNVIVDNDDFVDMVEELLQVYAEKYNEGKYILSGNVEVYLNAVDVDSMELNNIILTKALTK